MDFLLAVVGVLVAAWILDRRLATAELLMLDDDWDREPNPALPLAAMAFSWRAVLKSIPNGKEEERLLLSEAALLLLVKLLPPLFKSRAREEGLARISAASAASFIKEDEVALEETAEFSALTLFRDDVVEFLEVVCELD